MVCQMELTSHLWIGSAFDSYRSNEMKLAHRMTRAKQRGDVHGEIAPSGPMGLARRAPAVKSKVASRKPRQVKVYKNPYAGEVVENKGGNHKTLKEWKAEYGSTTVESWLTK